MQLKTVRRLADLTREYLLAQRSFGETSCRDVVYTLRAAIEAGPPDLESTPQDRHPVPNLEHERESATTGPGLISSIWQSFQNLTIRDAKILAPRLGFLARPETLQEIATTRGLSRERIRQMENEALKYLLIDADWLRKIDDKVTELKEKTRSPLSLHHAQELDPWFDGVSEYSSVLMRILREAETSDTYIIEVECTRYFARISQAQWNDILAKSIGIIKQLKTGDISREHAREMILRLLPNSAQEFSVLLWKYLDKQTHT